jgi:L-rhamnose isomerase
MPSSSVQKKYDEARQAYAGRDVDTDKALGLLAGLSLSIPCWQADDLTGSETPNGGGETLPITGAFPGKARNNGEIRADAEKILSLVPGRHRLSLHAMYGDFGGKKTDRDAIEPAHFSGWIDWAKKAGIALDFNATCFNHRRADSGFTLSHPDPGIREFWIEHCRRSRIVSAHIGRNLGACCMHDLWIPDGSKDARFDDATPRRILLESLDAVFADKHPDSEMKDFLESKLFGIGSESFVVGSHEFYLGYALTRGLRVCLDLGHFHPTESVADKLSALLLFTDEILLHISRGVRWDSDHVPVWDDTVSEIARRIVRGGFLERVHVGMDFFDASLNRIGAVVTGMRAFQKAFLAALLEPAAALRRAEDETDYFTRLAVLEESRLMPVGAVWDLFCESQGAPPAGAWIADVKSYERGVLSKRH